MLMLPDHTAEKPEQTKAVNSNDLPLRADPGDALLEPGRPSSPPENRAKLRAHAGLGRTLMGAAGSIALLAGGWLGATIYSARHGPVGGLNPPEAVATIPSSASIVEKLDKLAAEVGAMRIAVSAIGTRDKAADEARGRDRAQAGASQSDLARRLDRLADQMSDQANRVNGELEALKKSVASMRPTQVNRDAPVLKRTRHAHDAFDPSRDPTAPGVPRPLGSR